MTTVEICSKAIAILRASHDGDRLSPKGLKFVECAVNGMLTPKGVALFDRYHRFITRSAA
jgi:hypothetical protein